jgi:transcriptional regulator with GAF, ATPase, and Fis domain
MADEQLASAFWRAVEAGEQVDLEEFLRAVIDEIARRLQADRGTLYLLDHARGELVSRVAHLPELAEIRLRVGEGIAGWVAAHGEPVVIPGATGDPRFAGHIDRATGYRTRTLLAVPVDDASGHRLGVLQVLNRAGGPFESADCALLVSLAREVARLLDSTSLRSQLRPGQQQALDFRFNGIVGVSPAMRAVFERTTRAARTDATVLVQGESGAGKELIARAVHFNSPRRDGPFVKVDCAALPAGLIENELFGHERGAFTGADRPADGKVQAAHGGTLFLDEVGELPASVQGKLLRLLQEKTFLRVGGTQPRTVDLRFVCATHRDLEADVEAGRFRQDLYYRLRVVPIRVPPLRARGAVDLDRLIDHLLYDLTRRHGRPELHLAPEARAALHAHAWPGNVRELENCLEAAVVLSPGPVVPAEILGLASPPRAPSTPDPEPTIPAATDDPPDTFRFAGTGTLESVERAYITHVLGLCGGNRSRAAAALGIGRNTLLRKLGLSATTSALLRRPTPPGSG